MLNWILIAISTIGLAASLNATGPNANELAADGYSAFKRVLVGDQPRLPEAIRLMEEARKADGGNVDNLFNLARAYFYEAGTFKKAESLTKAEQTFARILELDPSRTDALSFHGSLLTQMSGGRDMAMFTRGVQELQAAVQREPHDITGRLVRAFTVRNFPPPAMAAMGDYDTLDDLLYVAKAFDYLSSDFAPHADTVMKALVAETYKSKGDAARALENFQAALAVAKPADPGQLRGREIVDRVIAARMNGGEKSLFADPLITGCHACHLSEPDKLLQR